MNEAAHIELYIDPPTQHFLRDNLFDPGFAGHLGHQFLAPYAHLKHTLETRGVTVHTADFLARGSGGARRIYVSLGRLSAYRRLAPEPGVILSAFFAMECPTVEPDLYRRLKDAQHAFRRIYSWSDGATLEPFVGARLGCLPLHWPQSFESVHERIWTLIQRGFLVMINGNKLPRYQAPCRELYSERMRAVEFFGRTGEIDLYGHGWDGPSFRVGQSYVPGTFRTVRTPGTVQRFNREVSRWKQRWFPDPLLAAAQRRYRGFADSKAETLGAYKFAICFENSVLKGWITEKIFDCFFAGTVPVYWGAPDVEQYIPAGCFIDMRRFKDYAELREFLKSLSERDIQEYKENARAFLKSPRFQPFTKQAFAEIFERILEQDAGLPARVPA